MVQNIIWLPSQLTLFFYKQTTKFVDLFSTQLDTNRMFIPLIGNYNLFGPKKKKLVNYIYTQLFSHSDVRTLLYCECHCKQRENH